ncbi:MAG: hypothetical protein O2779_04100 [Nanoarchaeota archaeon]|nr:hypothetical protein [Nanoarchaeota archaeon]
MSKEHLFMVGCSAGGFTHLNSLFEVLQGKEGEETVRQENLTGIVRFHSLGPLYSESQTKTWGHKYSRLNFSHAFPEEAGLEDDVGGSVVPIHNGKIYVCPSGWDSHIQPHENDLNLVLEKHTEKKFALDKLLSSSLDSQILNHYQLHLIILSGTGESGHQAIGDALKIRETRKNNPKVYILDPKGLKFPRMPATCIQIANERGYKSQHEEPKNFDYYILGAKAIGGQIEAASNDSS